MRGVAIAPAPIQTTSLLRSLPLPQQRLRQLSLPPLSSRCSGKAVVGRDFPLCGPPDAVSKVAPLRAMAASSSALPAAGIRLVEATAGWPRGFPAAVGFPICRVGSGWAQTDPSNDGRQMAALSVGKDDLLIVGAGVLGRIVAEKWKKEHPGCQTFGQTLTTDHHDELLKLGINPLLSGFNNSRFPFVIFCAPPYRSADYPADVSLATSNWSGEGAFLFTSSSAVYDCNDNGLCDEDCPAVPLGRNPRTDILLKAESAVLESGGSVLRLAGLYEFDRGAHNYWLGKGIVEARPDHILNLIHYEDAASLSVAILKKQFRNRIFMGCDNHPLSRQELMDCVNGSGKFDKVFQKFTGTDGPLGKRMNNSKTRAEVGWEPKYTSFPSFLGLTE